jgi:hypothetical protein
MGGRVDNEDGIEMTHKMTRVLALDDFEHWICFACGRFLLINWQPWRREVIEAGDESATHSGFVAEMVRE